MIDRIRLIASQDDAFASSHRFWNIRDALNDCKLGHISLSADFQLSIEVYPQFRQRGIASESLCQLNEFLAAEKLSLLRVKVAENHSLALRLFAPFAETIDSGKNVIISWSPLNCDVKWQSLLQEKIHAFNLQFTSEHCKLPIHPTATHVKFAEKDMFDRDAYLHPEAVNAWKNMKKAAAGSGIDLKIISAYRDFDYQSGLIQRKLDQGLSMQEILQVSALPGHSEHHSGCAIDIGCEGEAVLEEDFEDSEAFAWLTENAREFGFYMSYPKDNELGMIYEPWHWCHQAGKS